MLLGASPLLPCASHETQRKTVPVPESGEHGGKGGLRDEGLLESALARPKSLLAYGRPKDLYALAAAYGFGLAKNHPFFDGNKRVAFVAMLVFLEDNACLIEATEPDAVELMFGVAAGRIGERALATWLRSRAV